MLKGKNIDFSYSKDKTFIKNLNIDKTIIDLNNIDKIVEKIIQYIEVK